MQKSFIPSTVKIRARGATKLKGPQVVVTSEWIIYLHTYRL